MIATHLNDATLIYEIYTMSLVIFDLNNTLSADDSDYLWGQFLVAQRLVDSDVVTREHQRVECAE